MKRNAIVIVFAGAVIALAAWQLAPAMDGGSATPTAAMKSAPGAVPAASAGYVVHFDENGQISEEPASPDDDFNAALMQSISTSSEGLVEESTPVGDGVMVNLQGRFESTTTARIDANGNLVVPCLTNEEDVRAFTSSTAAEPAAGKE